MKAEIAVMTAENIDRKAIARGGEILKNGGLVAFSAGSVACAAIWSIEALILFRLIEATGAGAVCAVSTAIIKDCFKPERRTALFWFCR